MGAVWLTCLSTHVGLHVLCVVYTCVITCRLVYCAWFTHVSMHVSLCVMCGLYVCEHTTRLAYAACEHICRHVILRLSRMCEHTCRLACAMCGLHVCECTCRLVRAVCVYMSSEPAPGSTPRSPPVGGLEPTSSHSCLLCAHPRLCGGVRPELLCGLLLVPRDAQHVSVHRRLGLLAVVGPALRHVLLERVVRVHHPRH